MATMTVTEMRKLANMIIPGVAREVARLIAREEPPEKYLTTEEAAQYLGCSTSWLYKQTRAGRVPFIKRGHGLLFTKKSLRDYIEQRESQRVTRKVGFL